MKKRFSIIVALVALLLVVITLSSCQCEHEIVVDKAKAATCTETGLTEGSHCSKCNAVLVEQKEIARKGHSLECTFNTETHVYACSECELELVEKHDIEKTFNIESHVYACSECGYKLSEKHNMDTATNKCVSCDFETMDTSHFKSGYITTEYTEIETEHFICKLDAHTYVIADLEYYLETLYDALQIASGLNFNTDELVKIIIEVKTKEPNENGYASETHGAYAYFDRIGISTGDLFISGGYTIAHELSHVLQYRNSGWYFSKTLQEGFAEYNTYKTVKYLEENHPEIAYHLKGAEWTITNMRISDEGYEYLYSKPLSYWYKNGFPSIYAGNVDYTVGFRLMRYLELVYGDFSLWITKYQEKNPYDHNESNILDISEVLKVLPDAYGEDVETNFYSWLKENRSFFDISISSIITDRTKLEYTNIYPSYWYNLDKSVFNGFKYKDISLNIAEFCRYITEYKDDELQNFRLECTTLEPVTIKFYDFDGNLISVQSSESNNNTYSLDGVGYIKFVGEGTITEFNILGFW